MLPNNIVANGDTNFEPNHVLVNINKLKPYQFIASKMQNFEVQNSIYWEQP